MVLQSEMEELLAAWRALSADEGAEGWRTIPLAHDGACRLCAGRRFPGNEEALLVGFTSVRLPPASYMPRGHGFVVSLADLGPSRQGNVWIALCRQSAGSLDLFSMMTNDIISMLRSVRVNDEERLFGVFLARIVAWQDFMRRDSNCILGPEAEVGLFGELKILRDLLLAGLSCSTVISAWQGPVGGLQDFSLGVGAIEVKCTISPSDFIASIGSLEQLDDLLAGPLYLACVRLALDASGKTLPEEIGELRELMRLHPIALQGFESRLLHVGFLDSLAYHYTRRFSWMSTRILSVSNAFPRLTRTNVATEIRTARYDLDLGSVGGAGLEINAVLRELGVI